MADEARLYSRFVKPIYDAIDSRQYKPAIKLCQNKKVAALDIVQVLKAHCLERTGRPDEALDICRAVQRRKPMDETLLNTMGLVFRLCGCEHEMLSSYEHACAHTEPPNEELLLLLFVAYVRKGDFLKQQQTALKMFKAFGKIKYVCWAAVSMLMQVQHAGTPPKMLGLADRMLLKTMRETKSDDGEALQLLVHILQLQDKHDEALQAFDEFAPLMMDAAKNKVIKSKNDRGEPGHRHGPDCSHPTTSTSKGRSSEGEGADEEDIELGPLQVIDRLTLEATLTKRVGQLKRSSEVYKSLLNKYNADDWVYLTEFMDARITENDGGEFSSVETKLVATLKALAQKPENEFLRGPWLALVHLQSEKLKHLATSDATIRKREEAALVEHMVLYADRFYTKTCCFSDLKQYFEMCDDVTLVSETTKADLIKILQEMTAQATADTTVEAVTVIHEESSRKDALNRLHRRLFSLRSLRFLGAFETSTATELKSVVQSLVAEYEANAWLNVGAKGGQREVQNTDDLLLLAAHTLIDLYQRYGDREGEQKSACREVLVEAATLLEYGLDKSPYNFQMKLLLSRIYAYLGASAAMLTCHRELDVKHVQLDSLSYLVFDKLLQLCDHVEARRLCELILRQHRTTNNETPEFIARAYKLGVYSKVLDMTRFLREKMQHSHTLAIARGESLQFELQDALTSGPSELTQFLRSTKLSSAITTLKNMVKKEPPLSQNQDRSVVVQWTKAPLVAPRASFAKEGAPLTECDRSAEFASSLQWIQLQLVVPELLRNLTATKSEEDGVNEALAASYERIVRALGLIGKAADDDVKSRVWQWSVDVVTTMAAVGASKENEDVGVLVTNVAALQTTLPTIRDGIIASLSCEKALSAYGLSAAALLLRDAGLWAGALLCAMTRVVSKQRAAGKKDDPLVAVLRSVLKSVQETLAAVELHVKALAIGPVTDRPLHVTVSATPSADFTAAQQTVLTKVTEAHTQTVVVLSQLLKNAATSMRLFQQK